MVREGAVYQVTGFNGMVAATVCNVLEVLAWQEEERKLEEVCSYSNSILALYLKTHGDFLLVCILI